MKILLIEPFFTGSHRLWAEGYQSFSEHEVKILSLPGRHWKWRMYAGAVALATEFNSWTEYQPDLLLATDMLDLTTFLALTRQKTAHIPTAIYFHENQITYPWSSTDPDLTLKRENQYGFINYTSTLAADSVYFNSPYHKKSFLEALPTFLKQFPDYKGIEQVPLIEKKSVVLPLGINLHQFDQYERKARPPLPLLLWNHRWEYDKNPEAFFEALYQLKAEGIAFEVAILGTSFAKIPTIFKEAQQRLSAEIVQFGRADSVAEYAKWLWQADILPITNNQDFFGISVVEAIYCNCYPILPKRLAYPMHIPMEAQAQHFYEEDIDFYPLLKNTIINIANIRALSYKHFVDHYDWRTLAPQYDKVFLKKAK